MGIVGILLLGLSGPKIPILFLIFLGGKNILQLNFCIVFINSSGFCTLNLHFIKFDFCVEAVPDLIKTLFQLHLEGGKVEVGEGETWI